MKLFKTRDINIVKTVSRYAHLTYVVLSLRNVPES